MICNRCNTENSDGAAYCKECGNPLTGAVNLTKDQSDNIYTNPFEQASNASSSDYVAASSSNDVQNPYQQSSYNQSQYSPQQYNQSQYTQPYQQQMPNYPPMPPQDNSHMTVLGWIGRSCISLIPFVGPIIYIVMLFVWAFGDTPKKSLKTWAQAQLILAAISLVIMFLFMLVAGVSFNELANELYYY